MSTFNICFVKSLVFRIFPVLRKTQKVNLSLGVFGLIEAQSGLMSEITRGFNREKIYKHQLKRFWRFLSNPRIKPERLMGFWIAFCLRRFCPGKTVVVALDWTTLPGNIQCLMLALPYHGRAIPLFWQLVPQWEIKDSQNRIEERLIAKFLTVLSENKRVILTADRGFGRASFVQFLLKKGVGFVLRVRGDVRVKPENKKAVLLRVLGKTLKPEVAVWLENVSYRDDGVVPEINLAAVVAKGSDDPWFLVTNLKSQNKTIATYQLRFQIEEWFKDLKHQLGITDLQTKDLMRVRRLLFTACVSYALLMLIGNLANRFPKMKEKIITKGKQICSRIWLALEVVHRHLCGRTFWQKVWATGVSP